MLIAKKAVRGKLERNSTSVVIICVLEKTRRVSKSSKAMLVACVTLALATSAARVFVRRL